MTTERMKTIYLEEQKFSPEETRRYRVARRVNMVLPAGGTLLSQDEVEQFIAEGIETIVDPPWRHRKGF